MAELDIFKPQVSRVAYGLEGKSLCIWGPNRTGKTSVSCRLPKPVVLCMEDGLNAINGVPFFKILEWSTFVKFVKQITDPANLEKAKEMYQTIIIDQIESMADLCAQYICTKFGVKSIGEQLIRPDGKIDGRFNGYRELDNENRKWLRRLVLSGFTVIYLGHEGSREFTDEQGNKYTKLCPRGDRRIVDAVCDVVDIIGYVAPNGMDENGREIKSSLYMVNTKRFLAGSRFDYLPPYLPTFSAEALTKAVNDAVQKQEEAEGFRAVSFEEQKITKDTGPEMTYTELKESIQHVLRAFVNEEKGTVDPRVTAIIEEYLGKDGKVSAATPEQMEQLEMIYFDLKRLEAPDEEYEKVRQNIFEIAKRLNEENRMEEYRKIVSAHLGEGHGVNELTPNQKDVMKKILEELRKLH